MVFVLRLIVAIGCGLAYGLCFPPVRAHWLAWVVLVPALVVIRRGRLATAVVYAAALAAAGTAVTVGWLPHTVTTYFQQPWLVGWGLLAGVTLVMVVPPYVLAALIYRRVAALPRWAVPVCAAAGWVVGEWLRAHLWTGNPWVLFGYSQAAALSVVQVAALASVYGVSFVLLLVNVAVAEAWLGWRDGGGVRPALAGLAVAALGVLGVLGYGCWAVSGATGAASAPPVTVAVVQGNLDLGAQWRRDLYGRNLDVYLRLTQQAVQQSRAALVVWPETAMTFFIEEEPIYRGALGLYLARRPTELVAGGVRTEGSAPIRYFNAAYAIAPDGAVRTRYDKQRLLPFAEYFPLPQIDLLRRDFGRVRELTPGGPAQLLPTVVGDLGVLICNEAFFPELARQRVRAGATVLANLTNDTWVNDPTFSLIAFDMAVFRAVEQRRYLIRASTAGPSAIVDPWGRVTAATPLFTSATCAAPVEARTTQTPYARAGDVFVAACAALAAFALVWSGRR